MPSGKENMEKIFGVFYCRSEKKHDQKMIYRTNNDIVYAFKNIICAIFSATDLISIIHLLLYIFTMANTKDIFFSSNFNGKTGNTLPHSFLFRMQIMVMNIMKIAEYVIKSKSSEKEFGIGSEVVGCKLLDQNLGCPLSALAQWFHG